MKDQHLETATLRRRAMEFVVLLGIVSLCADVTYEGARSITGPFLASFGVGAAVVAFVSGFGELLAYGVRIWSGLISDRTRRYWFIALTGYTINLCAVPLLALAGRWEIAALLIILERLGKGIRNPARDAMLSFASSQVGRGWAFGLHEALDQLGAIVGPLLMALVLFLRGSYQIAFGVLAVPALVALALLLTARLRFPSPRSMEQQSDSQTEWRGFPRTYWIYMGGVACLAAGYVDYPLIAFHFSQSARASSDWIPLFYALAMGSDAVAALVIGKLYDRIGLSVLIISSVLAAMFAPLVFLGSGSLLWIGMALWGVGMGAQESVMRAFIAELVPPGRRGAGYGVLNGLYGFAWFAGSALMGVIYTRSVSGVVAFSLAAQIVAAPVFWSVLRAQRR